MYTATPLVVKEEEVTTIPAAPSEDPASQRPSTQAVLPQTGVELPAAIPSATSHRECVPASEDKDTAHTDTDSRQNTPCQDSGNLSQQSAAGASQGKERANGEGAEGDSDSELTRCLFLR